MWIATDNGLCRYSGHDYLYFFSDQETEGSLPSDKVLDLAVDCNDAVWVLTEKGLCYYDRMAEVFKEIGLPFSVQGIIFDKDRLLAFGGSGLAAVSVGTGAVTSILTGNSYSLSDMTRGPDGALWGSRTDSLSLVRFNEDLKLGCSLELRSRSQFRDIAFDCEGNLWAGRENGLSVVDMATLSETAVPEILKCVEEVGSNEVSVLLSADRTMYVCMPGVGIYTLDFADGTMRTDAVDRFELSRMSDFSCTCCDSENHPWIGTRDRGFGVRFLEKKNFGIARNLSRNTAGKYINGIALSKDTRTGWLASYYKGLLRFDTRNHKTRWYNYDTDPVLSSIGKRGIRSLMCDSRDRLWLNMEGKVAVCDVSAKSLTRASVVCSDTEVNRFVEDTDGRIWFCTENGLILWHNGGGKICLFPDCRIMDAVLSEDGEMYVAVAGSGIYSVNTGDLTCRPAEIVDEAALPFLKNPSVLHCVDGELWVGTHSKGLFAFRKFSPYRSWTTQEGLGSNDISAILDDGEGNIYVSTSYGLSIITGKFRDPVTYYHGRWMASQQFCPRSAASYGENLFFGGNTGLITLRSSRIIPNISDAPVNIVLTDLSVNGEPMRPAPGGVLEKLVNDTDRIVLRSNQNTIGLKFDYVSFIAEDNVSFSYRLSEPGSKGEWIDIGGYRSVNLAHLPSGHYILELASTNLDGFRCKEPRRLEIVVKKSPWISWYAVLAYLLVIGTAVWLIVRAVMHRRVRAAEVQVMKEELDRVSSLFSSSVNAVRNSSAESGQNGATVRQQPEAERKLSASDQNFINSVTDYIMTHMTGEPISIDSLSDEMCMSRASFFRKMKSLTGMTPSDFILSYRLDKAASMLREGSWRVNEISDMLGFSSPSHFTKVFRNKFGVSPKEFRG